MKKETRILFALLVLPLLVPLAKAETNYMGQIMQSFNLSQIGGSPTTTGAGASTSGTQRVILASDSPGGTVTLGPGSAIAGKVGIDQTTPGTTNRVDATIAAGQTLGTVTTVGAVTAITNALPAGTNLLGKVGIDQTTPGTTNKVVADATLSAETTKVIGTVNIAAGQSLATVSAVTAITNALPTGTNTIGAVTSPTVSAPTVAKVGATTTSSTLVAASATRKGIEVDCDCSNTDNVAIKWGAAAAVYANDKILTPCGNWQPPSGLIVTSAIQIVSNSGTQNCRVIEYP